MLNTENKKVEYCENDKLILVLFLFFLYRLIQLASGYDTSMKNFSHRREQISWMLAKTILMGYIFCFIVECLTFDPVFDCLILGILSTFQLKF